MFTQKTEVEVNEYAIFTPGKANVFLSGHPDRIVYVVAVESDGTAYFIDHNNDVWHCPVDALRPINAAPRLAFMGQGDLIFIVYLPEDPRFDGYRGEWATVIDDTSIDRTVTAHTHETNIVLSDIPRYAIADYRPTREMLENPNFHALEA